MAQGFTKQSITYSNGDVVGPASSTDLALARFDTTSGKLLQDSTVLVTDNGEMTNGSQPSFNAYRSSTITNVTGDATTYTIIWNAEAYDQNADFDTTTGLFTAPVTGKYQFNWSIRPSGLTTSYTSCWSALTVNTEASTRRGSVNFNPATYGIDATFGNWMTSSYSINLSATDTVGVLLRIAGSTKVIGVTGGAIAVASCFSGFLIC